MADEGVRPRLISHQRNLDREFHTGRGITFVVAKAVGTSRRVMCLAPKGLTDEYKVNVRPNATGGRITWWKDAGVKDQQGQYTKPKDVLSWHGPPGRNIYPVLRAPIVGGEQNDTFELRPEGYSGAKKADDTVDKTAWMYGEYPLEPGGPNIWGDVAPGGGATLWFARTTSNKIYRNGRLFAHCPTNRLVLGAALAEFGGDEYLVIITSDTGTDTTPTWDYCYIVKVKSIKDPTTITWQQIGSYNYGALGAWPNTGYIPRMGCYFFSGSGKKAASAVVRLDNVLHSHPYGDWAASPNLMGSSNGRVCYDIMRVVIDQNSENGNIFATFSLTPQSIWAASSNTSASGSQIVAIDYVGENEVYATMTLSYEYTGTSTTIRSNGYWDDSDPPIWIEEAIEGTDSIAESNSVTLSFADKSIQVLTGSFTSFSHWGIPDAPDEYSASLNMSICVPLHLDLRFGSVLTRKASLVTSTPGGGASSDVSAEFNGVPITSTRSFSTSSSLAQAGIGYGMGFNPVYYLQGWRDCYRVYLPGQHGPYPVFLRYLPSPYVQTDWKGNSLITYIFRDSGIELTTIPTGGAPQPWYPQYFEEYIVYFTKGNMGQIIGNKYDPETIKAWTVV